jgi:dihydropteroate synthase
MKLTAEQIQSNWTEFLSNIEQHITGDRKEKLLAFYKKYEERIILMPAAHKKEYHNAFPGGYVEHVNRVVKAALSLSPQYGKDLEQICLPLPRKNLYSLLSTMT